MPHVVTPDAMVRTIAVVVPVRNGARTLGRCLDALACQTRPPDEVLVVDNGSSDGSDVLARAFAAEHRSVPVQVLGEPHVGASAARNRGISAAHGDVIVFTDADCEPAEDWLERLLAAFAPGIGAVAGRVAPAAPLTAAEAFAALYTLHTGHDRLVARAFTLLEGGFPTANLAVRREVLGALGGFDERIRIYGEDYDLCARIYALGSAIQYEPRAVVFHHHRTTVRGLLRQSFGFGVCHADLLRRHFPRKTLLELPRFRWERDDLPGRVWVDLASADKKVAALLLLAAASRLAWLVLVAYVAYLYMDASRRFQVDGIRVRRRARVAAPFLLIAKSAAMTAGRLVGSVRSRVLCL